jgi:broad specificity phosphatase PhoE
MSHLPKADNLNNKVIILIRHGQTQWNEQAEERFRGRADINLDDTGIRQAELTARRITSWPVKVIYSSPLKRALRTAEILASPFKLKVKPLANLIDLDFGQWQGLSHKEAASLYPELYQMWFERPHEIRFPEGESLEDVRRRVAELPQLLLSRHGEDIVVLVSHKMVCKVIILSILGVDNSHFWQIEQHTSSINLIEEREVKFRVMLINDTCHLKKI